MAHGTKSAIVRHSGFHKWWMLLRPHTLVASFVPVFLGTTVAMSYESFHFTRFLVMLISCFLIQTSANLFNEYYDFKKGQDDEHTVGNGGAIVRNGMKPGFILFLAIFLYVLAILGGVYLCMDVNNWWIGLLGIISMVVGYLYTGGPYPIAYTPFGEIMAGFFMGGIITFISFYIQAGFISSFIVYVSIPVMVLVGNLLLANSIRDLEPDKANGRLTLAILLGRKGALILFTSAFIFAYVWEIALIFTVEATPWILIILLSVPEAIKAVRRFIGKSVPITMVPAMKATSKALTFFGILLAIAFLISLLSANMVDF
ncbi:1,4-dihydroxy-2-naphthoate octaprenyltransferase [Listeria newyorkensis]|uniref:1,4-dihydroxy-2-naphthoate octaprenyltransferase n=1 Tax=Listeria newyorkensis TaxID=1497681 RepID=A0A841Z3J1_9LIST|nr:1,4-dihydroxy-2-naphthoate polyprenyltransferase [Listeria newyorkensis]KGL46577.1 1,4-dihydroxy-2-naphthoate octaprenyltransferase [Listeria newyorkensis]MBC1459296.1 1,4-dihydroxy-2-naphthoate polyprenyltransferase [Listeria newyorkensis]PNP91080.1 1,4-dihydroxy-2-naphthoate octaprenyltransferase [Listeria newyorkensis]WAO20836.1 1,4-dihydroxy-2-naphthoate polyprenyltransferase [Listeria newyorkensis]SQC56316.1 1,4-dihydroxy-2-naphthoate octaprenyltransferase [Listeria newyorkensis]